MLGGFEYHINETHNIWHYVFFISYLKEKSASEYTGFESYIAEKIENKDISWFPIRDMENEDLI
jgi:hypothetical protein